ncbi:MAG TPA: CHRD domain-containing protein [Candidatus Saccharimonadales bacterium]|nr:CHRD domain-containing protein [Candidatus Saccharimonadales bacterium]
MKRVLIAIAAVGLLAAGCGGAGSGAATTAPKAAATTAAPTAAPTPQTVYVFTADLKPGNEIPPVTDAEASGSGTATVTLTTTKDSYGQITAATAKFEIVLKGFPATTNITLSHVHKGDAKTVGSPVVDSGLKAADPIALPTGGTSITKSDLKVTPEVALDLIANPANYYFNVHSQVHPSGTIRAQLAAKS